MTADRTTSLLFEIMSGLPRQGPGDAASTARALAAIPHVSARTRLLDLGCGTGAQTLVLASSSAARIVAMDVHRPFVEELQRQAQRLGIADRVNAVVGDMCAPGVPPASFDVVWCEGAIYNVGFEAGLRAWRQLLAPGGHLVVTDVCWTRPDPPRECAEFWRDAYPSIRTVAELLAIIGGCGYDCVEQYPLPRSSWWDEYYRPLEQNVAAFRERHCGEAEAAAVADGVEREIDIWRRYGEFYAYEFFVLGARSGPT